MEKVKAIQDTPVVLITGASRGIGRALAKVWAAKGAQLILVSQDVAALESLDDELQITNGETPCVLVPLDLREFDRIDEMAARIYERFGRLDVLIGNAGILGALSPVAHLTPDIWNDVFGVNVTANWRLIRAFDPLLRRAKEGKAIFITCDSAKETHPFWAAYSASKAALEKIVETYAREIENITNVKVSLFNPGPTATALRAMAFPGEAEGAAASPEEIANRIMACEAHMT